MVYEIGLSAAGHHPIDVLYLRWFMQLRFGDKLLYVVVFPFLALLALSFFALMIAAEVEKFRNFESTQQVRLPLSPATEIVYNISTIVMYAGAYFHLCFSIYAALHYQVVLLICAM